MVSVVITTYKRELKYLKRAIASVLSQSVQDWELIVVDDSPCDYIGRADISRYIQELNDSRVRLIQNPENYGSNKSRNIGLYIAKGMYIAYLDDDDEWISDKLEKEIKRFEECNENTAMVYGPYYLVKQDNEVKRVSRRILNGDCYRLLVSSCYNQIGSTSFPLLKTVALRTLGGFDETLKKSQDYDLWLRLARDYEIAYVESMMGYYYVHDGEQITKDKSQIIEIKKYIIRKHEDYLNKHKMIYSSLLLQLYQMTERYGKKWEKYGILLEAARYSPYTVARYLYARTCSLVISFKGKLRIHI